jgi:hypothetical protein
MTKIKASKIDNDSYRVTMGVGGETISVHVIVPQCGVPDEVRLRQAYRRAQEIALDFAESLTDHPG